jgi:division protein CdvB (Snf7/Vps24/ESCRT-III family)
LSTDLLRAARAQKKTVEARCDLNYNEIGRLMEQNQLRFEHLTARLDTISSQLQRIDPKGSSTLAKGRSRVSRVLLCAA